MLEPICDVWVCVDCYFAHHYGFHEHEGQWYAGDSDTPCDHMPLHQLEAFELTDNTDSETGEGIVEISSRQCEGCGSHYAGSRHRLALWRAA